MSFHNSDDETERKVEELESLEEGFLEDESSEDGYGPEIRGTAWELNKRTGLDYDISKMEDLVANYADHFEDFYKEDPSSVIDYLDRFNGDIDAAINSFKE